MKKQCNEFVIGADFGTDSCRAIIVDASDGDIVAQSSHDYPRWGKRLYCDSQKDLYRQHPADYIETFELAIKDIVADAGSEIVKHISGISFDTTASTPVLVDSKGTPLSLLPEFSEDPDAMFILWKDHTAFKEAEEINALCKNWNPDYSFFSGGTYSAEWVWSKVLHVLRSNGAVAAVAYSWIEHCDWMTAWMTGRTKPEDAIRSRCAAGHKAMWNMEWDGLPSEQFLSKLDSRLGTMAKHLFKKTYTSDYCAGTIRPELAESLGLPFSLKVGIGAIDAHFGAVGASISEGTLARIMGTSTCDILIGPKGKSRIRGICGQVDGSVIPGLTGYEAGQSAFGDIYAWFRSVLLWPVEKYFPEKEPDIKNRILQDIEKEVECLVNSPTDLLALDWFNGRRTPDANPELKGAILGLSLGTTAPMLYRSLVEATAFGSKAIVDRFISEGIRIDTVSAVGGISQKSPLVMQILSNVLGMPIKVIDCPQACALGAAMFASVVAGIHPTVQYAQKMMCAPTGSRYIPSKESHLAYMEAYEKYRKFGLFEEGMIP